MIDIEIITDTNTEPIISDLFSNILLRMLQYQPFMIDYLIPLGIQETIPNTIALFLKTRKTTFVVVVVILLPIIRIPRTLAVIIIITVIAITATAAIR